MYSPVEANQAERADFTGYFKEFQFSNKIENGDKTEWSFMTQATDSVTCDFVYIFITKTQTASKICEVSFGE